MNVDPFPRDTVHILSMAYHLPTGIREVRDIFREEGVNPAGVDSKGIDIEQVHVFEGEWRSNLALAAAQECLNRSNLRASDLGMIVDFSVMPQDYVVPSWCLSNKIQYELGAKNAFNLGFGGGGTSNFLVAVNFATSLLRAEQELDNALLIATDVSLRGNRLINRENPMTVLGDGASAVLISKGSGICEILETRLWSEGARNDICCIPGGGLAFPDRLDLYRLQVSNDKYSAASAFRSLKGLCDQVVQDAGVELSDISGFIGPNISARDQRHFADTFGLPGRDPFSRNRRQYGHVQGTDFIINLAQLLGDRSVPSGSLGLVCSHGWGFVSGATLIRY